MNAVLDFLRSWAALFIALVALVQPWVLALWRRFYRQAVVVPHRTGTVEVGFSDLGPTLGLLGTLEVRHRDAFIRAIDLQLKRLKDSASHAYSWGIFRPFAFGGEQTLELSSGFLVRPEAPHRYNVQFWDTGTQAELRARLESLRQEWQRRVISEFQAELASDAVPALQEREEELRERAGKLYQVFSREESSVTAHGLLQRLCYWEEGRYRLDFQIKTAHPEKTHTVSWEFELTREDVEGLRLNIVKVLQKTCGQLFGQYYFAAAPYLDTSK